VEADPAAVAHAVDELLADPDRRSAMGAQARRTWEERFTWAAVAQRYEAVYERLAA
jgi:glycosyltransferase involved in cell wall biosynthesis